MQAKKVEKAIYQDLDIGPIF